MTDPPNRCLIPQAIGLSEPAADRTEVYPALIDASGQAAQFAWEEFLYGKLRNTGTRRTYRRAIARFLTWCEAQGIELVGVSPAHVARYLDALPVGPATKKLHLSALRHVFDQMVLRHVVVLNPAACVRGERLQVLEGKTPEITVRQARQLLASIDDSHVVGLRDRAIVATMIYTAARVGAVSRLRRGDLCDGGDQFYFRFTEKGTKHREIPVRHDLQRCLQTYLATSHSEDCDKMAPLFRSTNGRTKRLTNRGMTAGDITRMVKRRLRDAGLPTRLSSHSLRVATVTDLLSQGVPLCDVQRLAGHADPRTTQLYDRRQQRVTRNIVERISI